MRRLALIALLFTGCATLHLAPGEEDVPPVRALHQMDSGDSDLEVTDGLSSVFGNGWKGFEDDFRKGHKALKSVRVLNRDGNTWDVAGFYEASPFAEKLRLVFDDAGRLSGFWFYGYGSAPMTEPELQKAFEAIPGMASAYVQAAEHRELAFGFRADQPQPVASQYKTLLLARACVEVGRGQRQLTDRLSLPAEVRGTPSCVLCKFDPGLQPTVRDYLHLLVSDSDNTSADFLRDLLGIDAISRTAEGAGVQHVPPLITTEGLFALECGLGPLRGREPKDQAPYLQSLSADARVAAADDAARDGFSLGPEEFHTRCDEGKSTGDSRKAVAHVIDWPLRADELVALYENAQLGQLEGAASSRCFLRFMGDGGSGPLPIGDHFLSAGAKNGVETDVRSLGLVVQSDRGPIAVSVSDFGFPDDKSDEALGHVYEGARALVEFTYARLPEKPNK